MPAAVERLTQRLQSLNPRATIDIAVNGALDPQRVIEPAAGERSGFVAEAEHSDGITSFVIEQQTPIEWLAFARAMETLIGAARRRPVARQGHSQRRRLPRAGRGAICPAPRPSAGRARNLAGWQPRQPRRVHHAQYCGARRANFVRNRAGVGKELILVAEVPRPGPCSHAAVLRLVFVPADAAAWGFNRHMAGPDKNAAAHMEDAG